jgi:hypothetical protein
MLKSVLEMMKQYAALTVILRTLAIQAFLASCSTTDRP